MSIVPVVLAASLALGAVAGLIAYARGIKSVDVVVDRVVETRADYRRVVECRTRGDLLVVVIERDDDPHPRAACVRRDALEILPLPPTR
jgi:hypothetical protein